MTTLQPKPILERATAKAVITVGSPVKEHSMLMNPQDTKHRVDVALETIKDGAAAVRAVDAVLRAAGLGGRANDSFIPYSAQAWDVNELGGNLMKLSHLDFVDNHVAERTDPAIWGVGGGLGKAITAEGGSVLARQMIEAGMNEPLDGKYQPAGYQTYGGMAR